MQPRILVIEDNANNTELMCYLIKSAGWLTLVAHDGLDGVAQVDRHRPDLVLCDIHVPLLNGFEIIAQLKASADLRRIPVIAVTALAMVGDRERAFAAGFDGYLPKPIAPETFIASLVTFLPGAKVTEPFKSVEVPSLVATTAVASPRNESILIVDDKAENIELCRTILAPMLREIHVASNVAHALRLLDEKRPELILTDIRMPEQSGLDLLDAVRREPAWTDTLFAVISSVTPSDFDVLLRQRKVRPDAIMFRPLEPDQLISAIAGLLSRIDQREIQT